MHIFRVSFLPWISAVHQEKLRQRAALVRSIQLGDVTAVLGTLGSDDVDEPLTSLGASWSCSEVKSRGTVARRGTM